jgi:hypothetical protein
LLAYEDLVARFKGASDGRLRALTAAALRNRGFRFYKLGRSEDALTSWAQVVSLFQGSRDSAIREHMAMSLSLRGGLLRELGRLQDALHADASGAEAPECWLHARTAGNTPVRRADAFGR